MFYWLHRKRYRYIRLFAKGGQDKEIHNISASIDQAHRKLDSLNEAVTRLQTIISNARVEDHLSPAQADEIAASVTESERLLREVDQAVALASAFVRNGAVTGWPDSHDFRLRRLKEQKAKFEEDLSQLQSEIITLEPVRSADRQSESFKKMQDAAIKRLTIQY